MEKNLELEYTYKEMIRLAEKADEYTKNSFDDFKLLGAIGTLVAFKPASLLINTASCEELNDTFLFTGFLALLFIIAIIAFFGLLRQSIATFYLKEVQVFESEVKSLLESEDNKKQTFHVAHNWIRQGKKQQRDIAGYFFGLFYSILIFYPTTVMAFGSTRWWFPTAYFFISLIITFSHYRASAKVHAHY